jgi:DNA-binding LytR/AlgR family response regulator
MNIVIIEDEDLTAQRLITLVNRYDPSINVLAEIPSVSQALSWFESHTDPSVDLIFMDIHLEDGDSFQIIDKLDLRTPIIFTTAFDGYMIRAFKVNSVDYLLKPVNYDELSAALNKFRYLRSDNNSEVASVSIQQDLRKLITHLSQQVNPQFKDRFMITVGTRIRSIESETIAYFYLEEKAVLLVTFDGTVLPVDYSLDKLVRMLDPRQFFRISRQFLVSLRSVYAIHTAPLGKLRLELSPKVKHEVTVSGDRISEFKTWLGKD